MASGRPCFSLRTVTTYQIVVDGELSDRFVATFGDMRLERGAGRTSLTGEIADQAQLHGLLARVAELGLSLVSFGPVVHGQRIDDVLPSSNDGDSGA
jgi:hypothetical protein